MPLINSPLDEGIFRTQIKNVIFVDPWRHDHQRALRDLVCCRFVLQQFHQRRSADHGSFGGCDILADLESVQIGHFDLKLALAAFQIVQKVAKSLKKVFTATFDGGAQDFRVGHHEIGRRNRVRKLPGIKFDLLGGFFIQPVNIMDNILHPLRGQQIGLFDEIKKFVVFPRLVAESTIPLLREGDRFRFLPQHTHRCIMPEHIILLPQVHLCFDQFGRILHHMGGQFDKCRSDIKRVRVGNFRIFCLFCKEV